MKRNIIFFVLSFVLFSFFTLGILAPAPAVRAASPISNPSAMPARVTNGSLSAGWGHTCAVKSAGTLACWGNSYDGQLNNRLVAELGRCATVGGHHPIG